MITDISIEKYLLTEDNLPIIDVRSPGEFEKGHIPGAKNIPLFTNEERAHVGTVYKQQSKEAAIELGYKYVTPKLNWYIEQSRAVAPNGKVAVHCWRGGMRSHSFGEHLSQNGFCDVQVVEGGYKAYRNYILNTFERPYDLHILGGYTGSGKTHILHELERMGEQVVDLEGLAHHKGSAFGSIGETSQPTVEQFENNLYSALSVLDRNKPIWLEDESHNIGRVKIPMPLFKQMREQHLLFVDIPKEDRARHLVEEYTHCDNSLLVESINKISKRLGGQNVKRALELLEQNDYYTVALISLQYYDKSYAKGMSCRNQDLVTRIELEHVNHLVNAETLLEQSTVN